MSARKIGTVEVLRLRDYALDAENLSDLRTTVLVEPGVYDLYEDGQARFWMMEGQINRRGFDRIGDGMFGIYAQDTPSGIWVRFPSRRLGPDEFAALLAEPMCAEGSPDQRLRITLFEQTPVPLATGRDREI